VATAASRGARRRIRTAPSRMIAAGVSRCSGPTIGPAENVSAAHRIADSGGPAARATIPPAATDAWATTAAARPIAWATLAAGTATRFAGTDQSGSPPCRDSSAGAAPSCAPSVTATSRRTGRGPRSRSATQGATTNTPAVADTDRTKPSCPASIGSTSSSTTIAMARAWRGSWPRPNRPPARTSDAIADARSTDGCHRVRTAYQPTATSPNHRRPRAPTPSAPASVSTEASIRATCLPDTTTRWERLAAANCSARSGRRSRASPVTRPTSRAARSGSRRVCAAARTLARTVLVALSSRPAGAVTSGGERGCSHVAACSRRRWPPNPSCSTGRAVARSRSRSPSAGAASTRSTRNPARPRIGAPSMATTRTRNQAPRVVGLGSVTTTAYRSAARPDAARSANGPCCCRCTRPPASPEPAASRAAPTRSMVSPLGPAQATVSRLRATRTSHQGPGRRQPAHSAAANAPAVVGVTRTRGGRGSRRFSARCPGPHADR
jgi:hypothetical protein